MLEGLPKTLNEQLTHFSNLTELDKVTCGLHHDVISTMKKADIPYIISEWRTKTRDSIGFLNGAPSYTVPMTDVHGVRIVLEEEYKKPLIDLLHQTWPTPERFYWGQYTLRILWGTQPEFEDPSKLHYSATHVNLIVLNGARFAEIQLHTPEQYLAAEILRPSYDTVKKG